MSSIKHKCPVCGVGVLKCHNTKCKKSEGHRLTWARTSYWECTNCVAYFVRTTPVSKLVKVIKQPNTTHSSCGIEHAMGSLPEY